MIARAIEAAKRAGKPIGICGQAPSDYPEFAAWLVEQGINSISLNPDAAIKTTLTIAEAEAKGREETSEKRGPVRAAHSTPASGDN
jgi:pyruvate,water dikinase